MHLIWQKKCDRQSFTFFFSFIFWVHWHLTHQVLIWINSFPSYLLINSCSSGQCDWLWPNQKMEYLMNIKMMNMMRENKSIHPSYSAYPVQGGGGGTGFHGLRVNAWKATTLCRATTFRLTASRTFKPMVPVVNLDTTSYANMHVFGLWEGTGVPGENPHRHTENMQTYTERPQTVFGLKEQVDIFS